MGTDQKERWDFAVARHSLSLSVRGSRFEGTLKCKTCGGELVEVRKQAAQAAAGQVRQATESLTSTLPRAEPSHDPSGEADTSAPRGPPSAASSGREGSGRW